MHNPKKFLQDAQAALDDVGGESLTGSGFESEVPETEFGSDEFSDSERAARQE